MWLGIFITGVLIVWTVGGLASLDLLPKDLSGLWDGPGEKELRIIQALALLLIVAGVTVFFATEAGTFWHDLWPEMISTGGAVLGIDELNRRRSAQEYKRGIIRQMASLSNDFALDAARIANDEGWLQDGTFAGADLMEANLAGANLTHANLTGANLTYANLIGGNLIKANLAGANLVAANLAGADLVRVNLEGASLREANITGARLLEAHLEGADLRKVNIIEADLWRVNLTGGLYDSDTKWPVDFDPKSAGAINLDELSEKEWLEWRKKYRPKWR